MDTKILMSLLTTVANEAPRYNTEALTLSPEVTFGDIFNLRALLQKASTLAPATGSQGDGKAYRLLSLNRSSGKVTLTFIERAYYTVDSDEGECLVWGVDTSEGIDPTGYVSISSSEVSLESPEGVKVLGEGDAYLIALPL